MTTAGSTVRTTVAELERRTAIARLVFCCFSDRDRATYVRICDELIA